MHKKNLLQILAVWFILIVLCVLMGKTTVASDNAVAAADFLNIGVGARSASLGGAYTSVADGPAAAYWNPGGLSAIDNPQFIFSHFSWYQDLNYEFIAAAYPISNKITIAASASYLSYGKIEGYDQYDNPTGELSSTYDMSLGLSGGYLVSDKLTVGLTAKYITLSLDGVKASAFAADLGAKYYLRNATIGVTLANVGTDIKFNETPEKLPVAIRAGLMVMPFGNQFMASLEVENQFYGNLQIKNGYEYSFENRYFIRAGYAYIPGQDGRVFGQTLSFGVGAILGPTTFDYTFSPKEKFSSESIHRFSIIVSL